MKPLTRVAIVAGEESGDILGAGLISALKKRYPDCVFEGVGGPRMIQQGFVSHFAQDRLAVMGLVEPLKRLPELLSIRKSLRTRYQQDPPDIFIGVDSPDFNLSLEEALKRSGIKTVHYVSPSVWAWRQGRIKKISRAVNLMLTLFPFEAAFYHEHKVDVHFVGHPLADQIPVSDQRVEARQKLGLDPDARYLALLPGSRRSEVEKLGEVFLHTAKTCKHAIPELKFLVAAANPARHSEINQILQRFPDLDVSVQEGGSHDVMAAADVVLMASGTTTLEAMLLKRPMVIAYRMAGLSYWILKRLVKSKYIGLPNLLAGKLLVPELIQQDATPNKMSDAVLNFFESNEAYGALVDEYTKIHLALKKNADEEAANAVENLWKS